MCTNGLLSNTDGVFAHFRLYTSAADQESALALAASVSPAFDSHKPAFEIERQDSAHTAL